MAQVSTGDEYHVIRSEDYDWIALYKNGKCLTQGHSIQEEEVLRVLGIEYTHHVASSEEFDDWGGRAPEEL